MDFEPFFFLQNEKATEAWHIETEGVWFAILVKKLLDNCIMLNQNNGILTDKNIKINCRKKQIPYAWSTYINPRLNVVKLRIEEVKGLVV